MKRVVIGLAVTCLLLGGLPLQAGRGGGFAGSFAGSALGTTIGHALVAPRERTVVIERPASGAAADAELRYLSQVISRLRTDVDRRFDNLEKRIRRLEKGK